MVVEEERLMRLKSEAMRKLLATRTEIAMLK